MRRHSRYIFLREGELGFEIISYDSLAIQIVGARGNEIIFPAIPLIVGGVENHSNVVTHCVLAEETVGIEEACHEDGLDFTGTGESHGYHCTAISEALTANDRPCKKGKKLSEGLKIMSLMAKQDHIDPNIFVIFIKERVYKDCAEEFPGSKQIDEALIPGYSVSAWSGGFHVAGFGRVDTVSQHVSLDILFV